MNTALCFLFDTISRVGSSILAGTLVSCLVLEKFEPLHIGLMLAGAALTALAYPLAGRSR